MNWAWQSSICASSTCSRREPDGRMGCLAALWSRTDLLIRLTSSARHMAKYFTASVTALQNHDTKWYRSWCIAWSEKEDLFIKGQLDIRTEKGRRQLRNFKANFRSSGNGQRSNIARIGWRASKPWVINMSSVTPYPGSHAKRDGVALQNNPFRHWRSLVITVWRSQ
jgi:hypothetical protein